MFDAILNKIAERSQAIKDKDAEIKALKEVGELSITHNDELVARLDTQDVRIKEVTDSRERAYDALREASRSADEAESKLLKIATALDITPEAEVAAAAAMQTRTAGDAPSEKEAEAPATEG